MIGTGALTPTDAINPTTTVSGRTGTHADAPRTEACDHKARRRAVAIAVAVIGIAVIGVAIAIPVAVVGIAVIAVAVAVAVIGIAVIGIAVIAVAVIGIAIARRRNHIDRTAADIHRAGGHID